MAITTTRRFGFLRWGAGSDPDTRLQQTNTIDALEDSAARLKIGAFNDRPAPGDDELLFFLVIDPADEEHHLELYVDSGPTDLPDAPDPAVWLPVNAPSGGDADPQLTMRVAP